MPDFRILSAAGAAPNFRTLQFLQAGWGVPPAEIVFDVWILKLLTGDQKHENIRTQCP